MLGFAVGVSVLPKQASVEVELLAEMDKLNIR